MSNDPAPYDHARAVSASAEAVKAVVEQAGDLGRYVGEVLGSAPHELMDIVTMHIRDFKIRTAIRLYGGTKRRLQDAGLKLVDLRSPSASIEVPLLEAALMEDREDLAELWEKLLAAAIAPDSRNRVRAVYIEILRSLEPLDAWFLQHFERLMAEAHEARRKREAEGRPQSVGEIQLDDLIAMAGKQAESDDCYISFEALADLKLLRRNSLGGYHLLALGKNFLAVVNAVSSQR